jgi:hypothetical protein
MRRALFLGLLVSLAPASVAAADGLPVAGVDPGESGVTTPGADVRYVTMKAGERTLVARVRRDGGRVLRARALRGRFTVPAVALDGSAGGLSADGATLVLIQPRAGFPRAETPLVALDARRLIVRNRIALEGDFSLDAISPGGATLYLIHYLSRRDPTRYEVRAYDLHAGRLLPEPVVDPREPGEDMRGYPMTRATSPDGRWEYTLYDGAEHPFIHALDTVGREAVCIDLDALAGHENLYDVRLGGGRGELAVRDGATTLAVVDLGTFRVGPPPAAPRPLADDDPPPWTLIGSIAAALLLGAVALLAARRSVPEVPPVGEDHGDAGGVGGLDDLVVTDRPSRLDDRGDAGVDRELGAV